MACADAIGVRSALAYSWRAIGRQRNEERARRPAPMNSCEQRLLNGVYSALFLEAEEEPGGEGDHKQ